MAHKGDTRKQGDGRYHQAVEGLRLALPAVARLLMVGPSSGVEIRVKQRGEYDWIAVGKCCDEDMGDVVAFGFGVGPIEALTGLDGQIASNRWRPDKPWAGSG